MSGSDALERTGDTNEPRRRRTWLKGERLSHGFWIYFLATLFFDAGFCIYFFLFNLYLLDLHFNEGFIGLLSGVSTVGVMLVMLPASVLVRRLGFRPVMVACYLASPLVHIARVFWVWPQVQIGLALLGGMTLGSNGVCYLPTVARLTTEKNRTAGFTLIFAASLASSAVGGLLCGFVSHWISRTGVKIQPIAMKQVILIASCFVAALAVVPAAILRVPAPQEPEKAGRLKPSLKQLLHHAPALVRPLLPVILWAVVLAAFFPFGNLYLANALHLSLARISVIFSIAQVVQLSMLSLTPIVMRKLGLPNGLLAVQTAAAFTLAVLACTRRENPAIVLFLLFNALQWMASPGLYDLAMTSTPNAQREYIAAAVLFCNSLVSALATPGAGALYTRFGYGPPMMGVALLALLIAALSRLLLRTRFSAEAAKEPPLPMPRFQPQ